MSICATDRAWALGVTVSVLFGGPAAAATDLEPRGEVGMEVRLHHLLDDFDDDQLSSYFDQYHGFWVKDPNPPYFLDLSHLDLGLARDDDTYAIRLERRSPHWLNERAELEFNRGGVDLELDYRRYRSDELRMYPVGTGGPIPTFGTVYNPDTQPGNPQGRDRRLYSRRTGVGGELRLRSDSSELHLHSGFEHRRGHVQDSFLLDKSKEVVFGSLETERFRGARRELDQNRVLVGGGLVLTPWQLFTTALDVEFETFREDAPVLLLGDIAVSDPSGIPVGAEDRAFNFIPDTRRLSGSLRLSRRIAGATFHGGASATHLEQDGHRSPVQRTLDLPDTEATTYSVHGALDVPLGRRFRLNAFAKLVQRHRNFDAETFAGLAAPEGQVDPFLERRRELTGGLQLRARIARAFSVGAGYRVRRVDRHLRFSDPTNSIEPSESLIRPASESHTAYLQGRARPLRRLQLSGELGHEWSPRVGTPRELESALYFKGRGTYTLTRPFTVMVSLFGKARGGKNDDVKLESALGPDKRKDFDRRKWSYGATLSALPSAELALFASFVGDVDEQEFAHIRSQVPRYDTPLDGFFLDSRPDYETELRTFRLGATRRLTRALDASLEGTCTWARLQFPDSEATSAVLEGVNEVRSRILSLEASLEYHLDSGTRVRVGYRLDRFGGLRGGSPLDPDTTVHSVILGLTTDLEF